MVDLEQLRQGFADLYGQSPRLFSAPGRVNLIGEHTDYNEGFVLPIAINRRTVVAAARRSERKLRVRSFDLGEEAIISLDDGASIKHPHWVAFVAGMARTLEMDLGVELCGSDMAITSYVPIGAGLSSSAALEISVGMALLALANAEVDRTRLALAAQRAEQLYAGANCGIMDQLSSVYGQKDHALLIDCRSLEITPVKLNLPEYAIVVCNTNVKHDLASSAYNERRAECELAVTLLRRRLPHIRSLRDVTESDMEQHEDALPERLQRRCRHVLTENDRTQQAATALSEGNTKELGNLMTQSHQSLRDDFDVSCTELDAMVEIAMSYDGVEGARMTGGGFGGCTVNLVRREQVESFREFVADDYERKTGITPATHLVEADCGASELQGD